MRVTSIVATSIFVFAVSSPLASQDPFPEGNHGNVYFCPRVDLNPEEDGGALSVETDGLLDEIAWERASWHGWTYDLSGVARGDGGTDVDEDSDFEWAAVADNDFLYVAWRATDDVLQNLENFQCDVWRDDSVELYIDALNDGPDCTAGTTNCYSVDDAQITIGMENDGFGDPELLIAGGLAGSGTCDFAGPHPELIQGVVEQTLDGNIYTGWQAEIAIALETLGNNDDGTPEWFVEPNHGRIIGWNIHLNDDDVGGDRDHKLVWSEIENVESSWRNPGAFAKLVFFDPSEPELPPVTAPVGNLTCTRELDGSVSLSWTNPDDADMAQPIRILVDDVEVDSLGGASTSHSLSEAQVPLDTSDHTITVLNSGGNPAICEIVQAPFDECGGIRKWNILGGFAHGGGAAPGEDQIRLDYMTDGSTSELDFIWFPGASVSTDFNGAAASTGLVSDPNGRNPGGVPTVFAYEGPNSRVFFQDAPAFGADLDNIMAYAQIYVIAEEETEAYLALSSDDSVQVLVNDVEVWINNLGRGGSDSCNPLDLPLDPVVLEEGENSVVVKVFEGGGGWDMTVGMLDIVGEPIAEGLSISHYPQDQCPLPPISVTRSIDTGETASVQRRDLPKWSPGATYEVVLNVTDPRAGDTHPDCPAAETVTITEIVPSGWTVADAGAGTVADGTISWDVDASAAPLELRYSIAAPDVGAGDAKLGGTLGEEGSLITFAVGGDSKLVNPTDFSPEGFVQSMLLLGPYTGAAADPGEDVIRGDWLMGGGLDEVDIEPRAGDQVRTSFLLAQSTGLAQPATPNGINPGNIPTWAEWRDADDTIDFGDYYGGDIDNVMMYSIFYVVLDDDMALDLGLGSDDSVQVLVDGDEVHINNIPRGWGAPNEVQDTVFAVNNPVLDPLNAGHHKVMVKVFDGAVDHGFRVRFQDPVTALPVTEGISICLSPDIGDCAPVPEGTPFVRGDTDADGTINLTDGIKILGFLFLGDEALPCDDAGDTNLDGDLGLTDAVKIFSFLFLGGDDLPPPNGCGEEPLGDLVTCPEFEDCR